ncbi:MAG: hypothetical protein ABSE48_21700, partial [Verrucomicrobiota bacterium]
MWFLKKRHDEVAVFLQLRPASRSQRMWQKRTDVFGHWRAVNFKFPGAPLAKFGFQGDRKKPCQECK